MRVVLVVRAVSFSPPRKPCCLRVGPPAELTGKESRPKSLAHPTFSYTNSVAGVGRVKAPVSVVVNVVPSAYYWNPSREGAIGAKSYYCDGVYWVTVRVGIISYSTSECYIVSLYLDCTVYSGRNSYSGVDGSNCFCWVDSRILRISWVVGVMST